MSSNAAADATPELELIPGGGDQISKWKRLLAEVDDRRQAALTLMEAELAEAEAELEAMDERRDELKAHVSQARRAVIALRSVDEDPAPKPVKPAKPKGKKDWSVSAARMLDVLQRMIEVGEPISPTQLSHRVDGLSPETARKAMEALRDEGRVRFVKKIRGGGSQYEPMPEEYAAAAELAGADA
jgi:hypothetical protein